MKTSAITIKSPFFWKLILHTCMFPHQKGAKYQSNNLLHQTLQTTRKAATSNLHRTSPKCTRWWLVNVWPWNFCGSKNFWIFKKRIYPMYKQLNWALCIHLLSSSVLHCWIMMWWWYRWDIYAWNMMINDKGFSNKGNFILKHAHLAFRIFVSFKKCFVFFFSGKCNYMNMCRPEHVQRKECLQFSRYGNYFPCKVQTIFKYMNIFHYYETNTMCVVDDGWWVYKVCTFSLNSLHSMMLICVCDVCNVHISTQFLVLSTIHIFVLT